MWDFVMRDTMQVWVLPLGRVRVPLRAQLQRGLSFGCGAWTAASPPGACMHTCAAPGVYPFWWPSGACSPRTPTGISFHARFCVHPRILRFACPACMHGPCAGSCAPCDAMHICAGFSHFHTLRCALILSQAHARALPCHACLRSWRTATWC